MKTFTITALILSAMALSACTVTAKDGNTKVKVETNAPPENANSDGTFCPPGQKKKGKC